MINSVKMPALEISRGTGYENEIISHVILKSSAY